MLLKYATKTNASDLCSLIIQTTQFQLFIEGYVGVETKVLFFTKCYNFYIDKKKKKSQRGGGKMLD